ncbi:MAG: hypothetical protein IH597_01680 [Bacteroidales bacterium]|nr:hypothetical protein [Bacteroidales bacterium]
MTNSEYMQFKKVLWGSVAAVIVASVTTAIAFYYSTTNSIQTISKTIDRHEVILENKIGRREFDRFQYDYDHHCNTVQRKFEIIDQKLDRLIQNQN